MRFNEFNLLKVKYTLFAHETLEKHNRLKIRCMVNVARKDQRTVMANHEILEKADKLRAGI